MNRYSMDLRERLVAGRQRGQSAEELSRLFDVSKRSVERYWKRQQEEATIASKPRGGYRRSCLEGHDAVLRQWIEHEPDLSLVQMKGRLLEQKGIRIGSTALWNDRVCAPCLLDGPMNGVAFLAYVEQFLAPELRPGDIVICDNLSSHKVSGVAQAIAKCGAQLVYLPAYSPDLNPIEMAFSKLKAFMRQAAQRTLAGLQSATAHALDTFTSDHCANYFRHANYATD